MRTNKLRSKFLFFEKIRNKNEIPFVCVMSYIQFASRAISKPIWRVLDFDTAVQKEIREG